jgi:hypothetical protein
MGRYRHLETPMQKPTNKCGNDISWKNKNIPNHTLKVAMGKSYLTGFCQGSGKFFCKLRTAFLSWVILKYYHEFLGNRNHLYWSDLHDSQYMRVSKSMHVEFFLLAPLLNACATTRTESLCYCSDFFYLHHSVILCHYHYQRYLVSLVLSYTPKKRGMQWLGFWGQKISEVWKFVADNQHSMLAVSCHSKACTSELTGSKVE